MPKSILKREISQLVRTTGDLTTKEIILVELDSWKFFLCTLEN